MMGDSKKKKKKEWKDITEAAKKAEPRRTDPNTIYWKKGMPETETSLVPFDAVITDLLPCANQVTYS